MLLFLRSRNDAILVLVIFILHIVTCILISNPTFDVDSGINLTLLQTALSALSILGDYTRRTSLREISRLFAIAQNLRIDLAWMTCVHRDALCLCL